MADRDLTSSRAQGVLEVPLHRALGMRLAEEGAPEQGLVIEVGELAANNVGVLHGGLAAALLDVAAYLAVLPALEPGTNAVTHSTHCSLLRSVPGGAEVCFRGRVERTGRSLAFLAAEAHHGDRLVATGQIVKSIVPEPPG